MDRPNPEPGAGADVVARCHPDKAVIRQLEGLCRTSEWPSSASCPRMRLHRLFHGAVDLLTDPHTPTTCMWVHGALSCGDDPLRKEFAAQRAAGFEKLRARFRRAVAEGDLPINADVDTLASFVQTIVFGLTVQASTGATRKNLLCVVAAALQAWPK